MKRLYKLGIITLVSIGVFIGPRQTSAGLYDVIEVYDGDTIAINMAGHTEKVRLIGVDTPETKDPRKPVQCYGPEASTYSHNKLRGAKVRLVADPLSTNRDRYDRLLRYVYLADGTFYNLDLLQSGNARAYVGFPFSKSAEFSSTEQTSKTSQKGLWLNCSEA